MVELEAEDYSELFDWFTLCFGKDTKKIRKALAPFYKAIGKNPAATEWAKYNTKKQRHKSEKIQSVLINGGVQYPLSKMEYTFIPYFRLTYLLR